MEIERTAQGISKGNKKHAQGYAKTARLSRLGDRKVYVSPYTGAEFETRQMMKVHTDAYRNRILKDFETMVREQALGVEPWERLPTETPLQYRRFEVYLHMAKRSVRGSAAIMQQREGQVTLLAQRWHWKFRADLWDRHINRIQLAEFEDQKRASAREQAKLGRKLQQAALSGATRLLADEERMDVMTPSSIAKLADVGTRIERLANSDPTTISEERGVTRIVWEGPAPSWAPQPDETPHGPLASKVRQPQPETIEGER